MGCDKSGGGPGIYGPSWSELWPAWTKAHQQRRPTLGELYHERNVASCNAGVYWQTTQASAGWIDLWNGTSAVLLFCIGDPSGATGGWSSARFGPSTSDYVEMTKLGEIQNGDAQVAIFYSGREHIGPGSEQPVDDPYNDTALYPANRDPTPNFRTVLVNAAPTNTVLNWRGWIVQVQGWNGERISEMWSASGTSAAVSLEIPRIGKNELAIMCEASRRRGNDSPYWTSTTAYGWGNQGYAAGTHWERYAGGQFSAEFCGSQLFVQRVPTSGENLTNTITWDAGGPAWCMAGFKIPYDPPRGYGRTLG